MASKPVDEKLAQTEHWLPLVLRYSSDGINICEIDPESGKRTLVMCNDRYVEMSGRTRKELMAAENLIGMVVDIETPPDFTERMLAGLHCKGTASWIRPDGKENYYEWTAAPYLIEGKLYVIGIDRDITKRMRAESGLRQSERRSC